MAIVPWSEEEKAAFLAMQFEAQRRDYGANYPDAAHDVILAGGRPAGRLYVDRQRDAIHIIDIALLPPFRNLGIGGRLLRDLLAEGAAAGKPVSIHVEINNPARRLYHRLGFRPVSEHGIYTFMRWEPPSSAGG